MRVVVQPGTSEEPLPTLSLQEVWILRGRAVTEFMKIGLADNHRAGAFQGRHDWGIFIRYVIFEKKTTIGATHPGDIDAIFYRYRQSGQQPAPFTTSDRGIDGGRLFQCLIGHHRDEGIGNLVVAFDVVEAGLSISNGILHWGSFHISEYSNQRNYLGFEKVTWVRRMRI